MPSLLPMSASTSVAGSTSTPKRLRIQSAHAVRYAREPA